jgi:hypothetical protein
VKNGHNKVILKILDFSEIYFKAQNTGFPAKVPKKQEICTIFQAISEINEISLIIS